MDIWKALLLAACLSAVRADPIGFLTGYDVPNQEPEQVHKTHVDNAVDALLVPINSAVELATESANDAQQAVYEHLGGDVAKHFPSHGTIKDALQTDKVYQEQAKAEVLANGLTSVGNEILAHSGKNVACNCGGYNQQGYYPSAAPGYYYPPPPKMNMSALMPKLAPNAAHGDPLHHDNKAFYQGGGYYYPGFYYPGATKDSPLSFQQPVTGYVNYTYLGPSTPSSGPSGFLHGMMPGGGGLPGGSGAQNGGKSGGADPLHPYDHLHHGHAEDHHEDIEEGDNLHGYGGPDYTYGSTCDCSLFWQQTGYGGGFAGGGGGFNGTLPLQPGQGGGGGGFGYGNGSFYYPNTTGNYYYGGDDHGPYLPPWEQNGNAGIQDPHVGVGGQYYPQPNNKGQPGLPQKGYRRALRQLPVPGSGLPGAATPPVPSPPGYPAYPPPAGIPDGAIPGSSTTYVNGANANQPGYGYPDGDMNGFYEPYFYFPEGGYQGGWNIHGLHPFDVLHHGDHYPGGHGGNPGDLHGGNYYPGGMNGGGIYYPPGSSGYYMPGSGSGNAFQGYGTAYGYAYAYCFGNGTGYAYSVGYGEGSATNITVVNNVNIICNYPTYSINETIIAGNATFNTSAGGPIVTPTQGAVANLAGAGSMTVGNVTTIFPVGGNVSVPAGAKVQMTAGGTLTFPQGGHANFPTGAAINAPTSGAKLAAPGLNMAVPITPSTVTRVPATGSVEVPAGGALTLPGMPMRIPGREPQQARAKGTSQVGQPNVAMSTVQPTSFAAKHVAAPGAAARTEATHTNPKTGNGWWGTNPAQLGALGKMAWWYNWAAAPFTAGTSAYSNSAGLEYVPMLWGSNAVMGLSDDSKFPNAKAILGFNEPNHGDQSNIDSTHAGQLWPLVAKTAKRLGLRLGSPSAAPCGGDCNEADPFVWWDAFFKSCDAALGTSCLDTIDFMATHYYTCNADYMAKYVNDVWNKYQKPIWITEMACDLPYMDPSGTLVDQIAFMRAVLSLLNNDTRVERYAWFAFDTSGFNWLGTTPSLLDVNTNTATDLGLIYGGGLPDSLTGITPPKGAAAPSAAQAAVQSANVARLSPQAQDALAQPVPPVDTTGSWQEACRPCIPQLAQLAGLPTTVQQAASQAACRACGFH